MSALRPVSFARTDVPQGTFFTARFDSIVQSFSFNNGRRNYVDSWNPGSATIVINNDENQAKQFDLGTGVMVEFSTTWRVQLYVDSVDYDDTPGLLGGATAIIQLSPASSRLNITATSKSILQQSGMLNLIRFNSPLMPTDSGTGPLPRLVAFKFLNGAAVYGGMTQGAQTYTGTVLQYLQTTQQTDNTHIWTTGQGVASDGEYIFCPGAFDLFGYVSTANLSFNSVSSSADIAYESIHRNYLDSELANTVTVTPRGLSAQLSTNTDSVATYNTREYSRSTYDFATATALSTAEWLATVMSDRAVQVFTISFTAEAQNATAYSTLLTELQKPRLVFQIKYRPAGSYLTQTEWVMITALEINATPDKTVFTVTLHPFNMYFPLLNAQTSIGSTSFNLIGKSRYNLFPNPSAESGTEGFNNFSGATVGIGLDPFTYMGRRSCKATATSTSMVIKIGDQREANANMFVKSSTTYTYSLYVFVPTSNASDAVMRLEIQGYNISAASTTALQATPVNIQRGKWTRLSLTYTGNSVTVRIACYLRSISGVAVGESMYVDNCMLEESSVLDEYFDGATRPAEWTGLVNDSASVLDSEYFRFGRTNA